MLNTGNLISTDDVNIVLLAENMQTVKENTDA